MMNGLVMMRLFSYRENYLVSLLTAASTARYWHCAIDTGERLLAWRWPFVYVCDIGHKALCPISALSVHCSPPMAIGDSTARTTAPRVVRAV